MTAPRPVLTVINLTTTKALGLTIPPAVARAEELVVNLKTASALGLTIPQAVLARADEVTR